MEDWKEIALQYRKQHEKDTNYIAAITIELVRLQQMEYKLLEIIKNGNAPFVGELKPNLNLVDDYYQRLVQVLLGE